MPELYSMNPGEGLKLSNYPNLKTIVQSGHSNIRGVLKYKDSLVYAATSLSPFTLPQNEASNALYECYRNGKSAATHTNGDIASKSSELW